MIWATLTSFLRYLCTFSPQALHRKKAFQPPEAANLQEVFPTPLPVLKAPRHSCFKYIPLLLQDLRNTTSARGLNLGSVPRSNLVQVLCLRSPWAVGIPGTTWEAWGPTGSQPESPVLTGSSLCCYRAAAHGPHSTRCSRTDSHRRRTCKTAQGTGPGGQRETPVKSETRDRRAPLARWLRP